MDNILIWQMGKVGSTAVKNALNRRGVHAPKIHWIDHKPPEGEFYSRYQGHSETIKKGKAPPLKIISLVREPMARNISAFFQKLHYYIPEHNDKDVNYLYRYFIENYNIYYPDEWFDKELKGLLGFDVFSEPFNTDLGYKIYKEGGHELLVMRLEDAEARIETAMMKFLGVSSVRMKKENVYSHKHKSQKAGVYESFKNRSFPENFLNRTYSLRYSQHFYTEQEIEKFSKKWE